MRQKQADYIETIQNSEKIDAETKKVLADIGATQLDSVAKVMDSAAKSGAEVSIMKV